MQLRLQVTDPLSEQIISIEVDSSLLVEDLKALVEVELGIPVEQQALTYGDTVLQDKDPISTYKLEQDDLIILRRKVKRPKDPLRAEANKILKFYQQNPQNLNLLRQKQPELAAAIEAKNQQGIMNFIIQQEQKNYQEKQEYMKKMDQLEQEPLNPENQKLIEELIQKNNIEENMNYAQEYIPESFGSVTMLYIELSVNKHPVQAFVDSGAQITIMSKACAERCGIMRLIDTRFHGMAQGVGTQKILGRIHVVEIQILNQFLNCSLTILEGDGIDLLFGLDMLKRFQCSIDLKENCLFFPNEKLSVKFLSEGQIHKQISITQEQEIFDKEQQQEKIEESQPQQTQPKQQQQQQQKQQKQQQPMKTGSQQSSKYPESVVAQLINMGVTRQEAIRALDQCSGNAEMAASLIASQKYGF